MENRKQVNLDNLGKVKAAPTIQAVGGTNQVAVPTVLKDNSLLRLSRSLAQFGNIIGQTSNINQQLGKEAAEELTADEINDIIEGKVPAPSGGALGKLGFQKAFHQISAKRYADTTALQEYADAESRINLKLDELVQSSTPIEAAMSYVDEELQGVQEKIGKYFENNVHGQRVINMITGELGSRVRTGSADGYVKKQKAYLDSVAIEKEKNGVLKVFSGEVGPTAYLQGVDKKLKALGKNPLERNAITRSIVVDATETLIDRGRFTDAAHYLSQWQKTKIGGKPINQTLEMEKTIAALASNIATAKKKAESESDDGLTFPQQEGAYVGTVVQLLDAAKQYNNYSPRHDEEGDQSEKLLGKLDIQIDQVLYRLQTNYPESVLVKWKKEFKDKIITEKTKGNPLTSTIRGALSNLALGRDLNNKKLDDIQISEKAGNISHGTVTEINKALDESGRRTLLQEAGGYNDEQKKELEEKAREEFQKDWKMDTFDFIKEFGDPSQPPWRGLKNVHIDVHKIDWINEEGSPYANREIAVRSNIGKDILKANFEVGGDAIINVDDEITAKKLEVNEILTREMTEEARVISEMDLTLEEKEEKLKEFRDYIINEENEELGFHLKAKAKRAQLGKLEKTKYEGLHEKYYNNGKGESKDWKTLKTDKASLPTLSDPEILGNAVEYKEAIERGSANASDIDIPWNKVDIDLKAARQGENKRNTLMPLLMFYGYPEFDEENVVEDLKRTSLNFDQVRLVSTHEQLDDIHERFLAASRYFNTNNEYIGADIIRKNKGLSKEETVNRKQIIKDLEIMSNLGIEGEGAVIDFITIQTKLLPPRQVRK